MAVLRQISAVQKDADEQCEQSYPNSRNPISWYTKRAELHIRVREMHRCFVLLGSFSFRTFSHVHGFFESWKIRLLDSMEWSASVGRTDFKSA